MVRTFRFYDHARLAAELEILAIEDAEGDLMVTHAMKMRRRYRQQYEEASAVANRPVKLKDGRVLDRALIEKLSSDAELAYDLHSNVDAACRLSGLRQNVHRP